VTRFVADAPEDPPVVVRVASVPEVGVSFTAERGRYRQTFAHLTEDGQLVTLPLNPDAAKALGLMLADHTGCIVVAL
jgi:uncharacterized lipoprotein YajG